MATAQSVANYQSSMPDVSVGVNPHMNDHDFGSGQGVWSWFLKTFGGYDAAGEYQNALTENNRRYEQAMLQDARNYETWFDSTAVQRRMADLKAAGVNPWLALQSGGISSNGSSSANSYSPGSGSSAKRQASGEKNGVAFLLMAVARLLAAT